MRINVKTEITDYDGKSIPQSTTEDEDGTKHITPMTIGSMMITALNNPTEDDKNISAEKKVARAVLSQEIHNNLKEDAKGIVDIDHEVIVEIKKLMNSFFFPLALMRAFEIFDPKVEEVSKKAK